MADIKVSALSGATAIDLDDLIYVVKDGVSEKATVAEVIAAAFVNTAPTLGWYSPSADLIRTPNSVTIDDQLVVSGAGPHAIGGAASGTSRLRLTGSFTGSGAATETFGNEILGTITGANGDTNALIGSYFATAHVTQTASENIDMIAQARFDEPQITDNLTGSILVGCTVYISSAPTEGDANYSLFIDGGSVRIDGTDGAGVGAGTITNAPSAGNPDKWIPLNSDGTQYWIPAWAA